MIDRLLLFMLFSLGRLIIVGVHKVVVVESRSA